MSLTTAATALRVEGLGHGYGEEAILADVSFELARGAVAAIVGPSGAGKTTLLHLVGGLAKPQSGSVRHDFSRPAFVFQDPLLLPWRTARGNIDFALSGLKLTAGERRERIRALLLEVGFTADDGGKYPHQLSGGMRKRVALARALAVRPDLLLLDEPFGALDFGLARQMQALVRRLIGERSMTALLVTHDLAEAVRLADTILVLGKGRPASIVAAQTLSRPPRLRDDAYVEAALSRLIADRDIRAAFDLDPAIAP